MSEMDLSAQTNAIVTDFTTQPNTTNFGSENAGSVYNVKIGVTFELVDTEEAGKVVISIPLDNTLETELSSLAAKHERYSINNFEMAIDSVAPFGTSSGAVQVANIPDPNNANFGEDLAENLAKVVRQSGSICVRPRDSKIMRAKTEGTSYCKMVGDARFWSYGAIVIIVREPPATGDYFKATLTVTCTFQYYKTTINSDTSLVRDMVVARVNKCDKGQIQVALPDLALPNIVTLRCNGRMLFTVVKKVGGTVVTRIVQPSTLPLQRVNANDFKVMIGACSALRGALSINTPFLNVSRAVELNYYV